MLPDALAAAAADVAAQYKASFQVTVGDDLLTGGYPLVHAVGRAGRRRAASDRFPPGVTPDRPK